MTAKSTEIQARAGDAPVELPAGEIEFQAICGSAEPKRSTLDISGAIENLVYDFLEDTHSGWGNDDGAYGDFTFDVAERTITLDYYERFTQSRTISSMNFKEGDDGTSLSPCPLLGEKVGRHGGRLSAAA